MKQQNAPFQKRVRAKSQAQGSGTDTTPGLTARKTAARLLGAVVDARTSLDGLTDNEHGHPQYTALDMRDRALVRAILATALRYRVTIGTLISQRLEKPLPIKATTLTHILHVAAAQILFLDLPDSAAVDLAVTHAKSDPRTVRFSGLVNAVLRALVRVKETELPKTLAATDDAPEWFKACLVKAYGVDTAHDILAAHRLEAPIDITAKSNPQLWAERLGGVLLPSGSIRLEKLNAPITELPGFAEGSWWVQDVAASLPARMLGNVRGLRVADLCAAPGGKTAQLVLAGANVTAFDTSRNRLERLKQNLHRLGLQADVVHADLLKFEPTQDFDAVLLDAPCSSTGTVRRHPDVPWTKTPDDINKLADLQQRLLTKAVELTKPGGTIVFSNCSLDPLEGEDLIDKFMAEAPAVCLDAISSSEIPGIASFITKQGTLRTTPAGLPLSTASLSGLDGFFAARLNKVR